jgi:hypothetical protein
MIVKTIILRFDFIRKNPCDCFKKICLIISHAPRLLKIRFLDVLNYQGQDVNSDLACIISRLNQ